MKVLRKNGQPTLDAYIDDVSIREDKAYITMLTYSNATEYTLVLTGSDIEDMKMLFNMPTQKELSL